MIEQALDDNISENDEEDSCFQDVDILQKHGINVADIKKLKGAGICTIKGIQMCTKKKLCNIKGFSETKVDKIREACLKIITLGFMTALEVSDRRKHVFKISTGSTEFDRPDRLRPIADRFNLEQTAVLDNVLYARAYTSEHQAELLDFVAAKFHEEAGVFKLLIIDSVMALFRVDFSGRGELADRQQKLAQVLSRLQKDGVYHVGVRLQGRSFSHQRAQLIGGHPKVPAKELMVQAESFEAGTFPK
ncbi:jg27256 [Pararge aegeria aegeria]|uniref:Jg27256 protein n=1 Tax=Pararge aegeria aegeria TaxID=348720 RepID=A0A8S4RSI6_9NEOP|nr:jg27256 [Pararge aegeria aegeria]